MVHESLTLRGRLVDRGKGKKSSRKSNPIGISKTRSPGPMKKNCWQCDKVEHYRHNYKSMEVEKGKWFEEG